jgi:uncharacterized protein YceK
MERKAFLVCVGFLASILLSGCGSTSSTSSQIIGADIIQKYNFHITGQSDTNNFTLSSQVGNFDLVETACNQAGYDLMPYVGQHITEIGYSLAETISGASIYLIVFATDQTTFADLYVEAIRQVSKQLMTLT